MCDASIIQEFFFFSFGSTGQVMLKSEIVHSEMPRAHCGNPWQAAAWTQQPLPPMPPPADLESAAPLPPFDNMINRSIREQVRRHPASKNAPKGACWGKGGMPSHRVPGVMVWKCTMSQSVFCYVPVQWREKTGEARELMKWLHSGREGRGGTRVEQLAEAIIV